MGPTAVMALQFRNRMSRIGTNGCFPVTRSKGQNMVFQQLTDTNPPWSASCSRRGMRSDRGYTLFEVMITLGLIGVISAITIPVFLSSNMMNTLWTSSERVGALVRQTRLKAISQNTTYEVRFDCPNAGDVRGLVMSGDP